MKWRRWGWSEKLISQQSGSQLTWGHGKPKTKNLARRLFRSKENISDSYSWQHSHKTNSIIFLKRNANHGYWQIQLDQESQLLPHSTLHLGVTVFWECIKSAQEVLQKWVFWWSTWCWNRHRWHIGLGHKCWGTWSALSSSSCWIMRNVSCRI